MPLPSYENPPVQEVVCGVVFEEMVELGSPHFGLYWARIRDRFPNFQEATPVSIPIVGEPAGAEAEFATLPPLRRVWYMHENRDRLLQLQSNALLYNWRRVDAEVAYPRFDTVHAEFLKEVDAFGEFLQQEGLPAMTDIQYELTYINHVLMGEGWEELSDLGGVFRHLSAPANDIRYGTLATIDYRLTFEMPDAAGRLSLRVRNATRKADNVPLLAMDVVARGRLGEPPREQRDEWFRLAHETIVEGFEDFMGSEIQDEQWRREE